MSRYFEIEPELTSMDDLAQVHVGNSLPVSESLTNWDSREIAVCQNSPGDRDLLTDLRGPLCTTRFKDVIEHWTSEKALFLPIRLESIDGQRHYPEWWIIVVLEECALVDAPDLYFPFVHSVRSVENAGLRPPAFKLM